jgi:VWFA-related protein
VVLWSSALVDDPDLPAFERVVQAANRADAARYFVDVRGLEGIPGETAEHGTFLPSIDQGIALASQALETAGAEDLAADTGGFTVKGSNDLTAGFRRIAVETRNYYLLGYSPSHTGDPSRLRKIQVEVKRKGVEVRARSGYYVRPPAGPPVSPSSAAPPEHGGAEGRVVPTAALQMVRTRESAHEAEVSAPVPRRRAP